MEKICSCRKSNFKVVESKIYSWLRVKAVTYRCKQCGTSKTVFEEHHEN